MSAEVTPAGPDDGVMESGLAGKTPRLKGEHKGNCVRAPVAADSSVLTG